MLRKCLLLMMLILALPVSILAAEQKPIPMDQAFKLSIHTTQNDSIAAKWKIAKNYYLYKDRFKFTIKEPKNAAMGKLFMPAGIEETDELLGKHRVYEDDITIHVPLLNPTNTPLKLLVEYQGCAKWGFCYPPEAKLVTINSDGLLSAADISISDYNETLPTTTKAPVSEIRSEQSKINSMLQHSSAPAALLLFFGFGLLLSLTPCVLPMIPILSGIIVGHGKKLSTKKALSLSSIYVLGMAISFAIVGAIVGLVGSSIQAAMQTPWVIVLFSLIFVALSLSLFGFYELQLPQSLQQKVNNLSRKQKTGSYAGVFIMGVLSTLIVSPCVSAPLVGALAYIGNTGNALFGGAALFTMALGMGLPLLIIGTSFGKLLPRAGHWMHTIKSIFGVIMLGVAIWMLERILPGPMILFLWASLIIISSIFMGALSKTAEHYWGKLWKGLGVILLTYGVLLIIGAALGNSDPFNPLHLEAHHQSLLAQSPANARAQPFIPVKSLSDINREVKRASKLNKPVMLDFYADWCISCKEMEKYTFSNPKVRKELNKFVLLQANVTANDALDKKLMRHFGVIAPPTMIFFTPKGEESEAATLVGEINAEKFLQHLLGIGFI